MDRLVRAAALVLLAGCFLGCTGSSGPPTVPLEKVSGTVKMDGKPMPGGEVRFAVPGQPVKTMEIKDGAFAGEAHVGKNNVEVVWEKEGPPHPMNPKERIKVNAIADRFSGPNSVLEAEVTAGGKNEFTFDVTSKN